MTFRYVPKNVCSRQISFDLDDGVVRNVRFEGGCDGNTQGVARLAEGRRAEEIVRLLSGVDCQGRGTSCPDQFSLALKQALADTASRQSEVGSDGK